ncbi:class I SAM-dependent methyltransferase [Idiomarina sp. M1R2S28]|uniref:Class I SAM-dependent methyltransferase n=1 Tax=Idiomarina rhizosphaerae TaxID=2961572 RepID=A0A9X2JSC1_9GAMM|nr:class I SAM-dependent methyltransferase [Idiomarina rhizosphaerae]MCP1338595.1 class I SAM-dependent methyltransferase [Idiomarina rhizosphaerae]
MSAAILSMLGRQSEQPWANGSLLVIHPGGGELAALTNASAWSFHAGHAAYWEAAGRPVFCQIQPPNLNSYDGVLFLVAKEKELNQYLLEQLASLPAGTPVWFAGEKRSGIQPLMRHLPAWLRPPQKLASANHCLLFASERNEHDHQSASIDSYAKTITFELNQQRESFVTLPGVFSREHIDPATLLLLQHIKDLPKGRGMDFACGAGVIAKQLVPQATELMACDVSPIAIAASEITLANEPVTTELRLADGIPDNAGQFDFIVSNPPFHTGQKTDYEIARKFISNARQHLNKKGVFRVVANRFLPWPEAIESVFGNCSVIADDGRYRVYHATCR